MVGCWWQPTTIVQCQSLVSLAATIVDKGARGAVIEAYKQTPRVQHKERESLVVELQKREEERKKEKGCHQQPCCLMQLLPYVAMRDGS